VSAERAGLLKRVAGLEREAALTEAKAKVDALMEAGKAVPAQRDTLVKLALADPKAFAEYTEATPELVKLAAEKGSSKASALDEVPLTDEDERRIRESGLNREAYIRTRAEQLGISLPEKQA